MSIAKKHIINASPSTFEYIGGGTNYLIERANGYLYAVYIDMGTGALVCAMSTDRGISWNKPASLVRSVVIHAIAVWYDAWSGITASEYLHIAYTDGTTDDTLYLKVDLNTLASGSNYDGSSIVLLAGTSTTSGGALSITRAQGGNIIVATCIDAAVEYATYKSTDEGGTWGTINNVFEAGTTDQVILLPGWNEDTQDIMAIFWDASANEISRKKYDDSAGTWSETSIATTMTDTVASSSFPHFAAICDLNGGQNILIAWSTVNSANADLRCWKINDTTITEVTNVVLNSGGNQGFAALGLKTKSEAGYAETLYAFYAGKSDNSDVYNDGLSVCYKTSTDKGTTWSAEIVMGSENLPIDFFTCCPKFGNNPYVWTSGNYTYTSAVSFLHYIFSVPHSTYLMGI